MYKRIQLAALLLGVFAWAAHGQDVHESSGSINEANNGQDAKTAEEPAAAKEPGSLLKAEFPRPCEAMGNSIYSFSFPNEDCRRGDWEKEARCFFTLNFSRGGKQIDFSSNIRGAVTNGQVDFDAKFISYGDKNNLRNGQKDLNEVESVEQAEKVRGFIADALKDFLTKVKAQKLSPEESKNLVRFNGEGLKCFKSIMSRIMNGLDEKQQAYLDKKSHEKGPSDLTADKKPWYQRLPISIK